MDNWIRIDALVKGQEFRLRNNKKVYVFHSFEPLVDGINRGWMRYFNETGFARKARKHPFTLVHTVTPLPAPPVTDKNEKK